MSRLHHAQFVEADLSEADLLMAALEAADLSRANLTHAKLFGANRVRASFDRTDFSYTSMGLTIFGYNDLSNSIDLETVLHSNPSFLSIDTIYRSKGKIPEIFLRGCGVPEPFIVQIP
jgi:uncharacterized protein YjbI with pentapeptide repeats